MEWSFLGFLAIFLWGLALNLTPCVYPMLSVTAALFHPKAGAGQGKNRFVSSFWKALLYVLGISFTYSSLGVLAALTGGFFGSAIQSPKVLTAIAIVMLLLAFSMFGLYEFRVPASVLSWIGGKRQGGLIGIFLSGVFVGFFAAPCIGPPIVALLTLVSQTENPAAGFFVFFVLSLGLGFPYLVLGTFSGLLAKIPRSGEWLVWVKSVFGVVLIGFALYYFALALYSDALPLIVPGTLIFGGGYLGFMDRAGNKTLWFRRFKQIAGAATALVGLFFFFAKPVEAVAWEPYSAEKVEAARKQGTPVIVDFYADWCFPCHELERYTYSNKEVIGALEPFLRLKVDATHSDTADVEEVVERFDVVGVPTILFLDAEGKEIRESRITGFVPPKEFLKAVELIQNSAEKKAAHDSAGRD
jgi:thiol:disulfide interchange protein DsbD